MCLVTEPHGLDAKVATLQKLAAVPVTVNMLRKTHVAKVVNRDALLCNSSEEVRQRSSELVARWRQLVRAAAGQPGAAAAGHSMAPAPPRAATSGKRGPPAEAATPVAKRHAGGQASRAGAGQVAAGSAATAVPPPGTVAAHSGPEGGETPPPAAGWSGSRAGESGTPAKVRTVNLVAALTEAVPHCSSGRRGGLGRKNYFCFDNYKAGNCNRGGACPFPHYTG